MNPPHYLLEDIKCNFPPQAHVHVTENLMLTPHQNKAPPGLSWTPSPPPGSGGLARSSLRARGRELRCCTPAAALLPSARVRGAGWVSGLWTRVKRTISLEAGLAATSATGAGPGAGGGLAERAPGARRRGRGGAAGRGQGSWPVSVHFRCARAQTEK